MNIKNKKARMPLVSVIIPSFNHELFISDAINSVFDQTYNNIELIVVDDGSKDSSLSILSKIKNSKFSLLRQKNRGAHAAINRGIKEAKGKFLAILNSDDLFHKDRIRLLVESFDKDTLLVCSWLEVIDSDDKILGVKQGWKNLLPWNPRKPEKLKNRFFKEKNNNFKSNLFFSNFISTTSNIIFKKKLIN